MLKFKITSPNVGIDKKPLVITKTEFDDSPQYIVLEDEIEEVKDGRTITFTAKDIYQIQEGSYVTGYNNIPVSINGDSQVFTYTEDLMVTSVSKPHNTFSVDVKKIMDLTVDEIGMETRYNAIRYDDNQWKIDRVSKDWVNEHKNVAIKIETRQAACGKNTWKVRYDDGNGVKDYDSYQVFYYENSSWKTIQLLDVDNMEGCRSREIIEFRSFNTYDDKTREIVDMNKEKLYYTEEVYVYIKFSPTHFFSEPTVIYVVDDDDDGEYVSNKTTKYGKSIIKEINYPSITLSIKESNNNNNTIAPKKVECHIDGIQQLSFNYNLLMKDWQDIIKSDIRGLIDISRESLLYDVYFASFDIVYDATTNIVQIPLSQNFETDLFHNDALQLNFVNEQTANAINPIMDLEKDVYKPVISTMDEKDFKECFKIIFNLHFREHRNKGDEEWICDKSSFWNGTAYDSDKKELTLRGNVTNGNKSAYFSYFGENDKYKEYQSDLLSYLGFNDKDIKYQKSKLKKSFLRISFYDSDNIGNQNLLHTSTIFLDSGNLFAKYIKNSETDDMFASTGSSLTSSAVATVYGLQGLTSNREPVRDRLLTDDDFKDNVSDLEDLRLSSQFVVCDKYSSNRSSEGFYFYTYKNNDGGVYPSDLYMRVEFNHAGYGRTIPFMMPYIRQAEEKEERYNERDNKIKTFTDICSDWSEGNGYSTVKYLKYSYIRWKYRYDKNTQQHIYYLDPDVYGTGVSVNNNQGNNIILNLYEGKII